MKGALISAALVVLVGALVALQITTPWSKDAATVPAWPLPARSAPAPQLQVGVTTKSLALNSHRGWSTKDLQEVNAFERAARRHSDIVMWFADWHHVADFDARQAAAVARRGSTPEISWEPWDANAGARQPAYRLATIIAGAHDAYIRRWARQIAAYGEPLRIRFAHEMNGRWYPWAERANSNRRGEFASVWRRVGAIFEQEGADNVTWVWSPVAGHIDRGLYPGSSQVDALAVSGFIAGAGVFRGQWRSFAQAFGPTLTALHRLDPRKPLTLSEIGVADRGGDKGAWIRDMFAEIKRRPYIRSLVWFNLHKEADWRISSSRDAQAAFAAGLSEVA